MPGQRLDWIKRELDALDALGLRRELQVRDAPQGPVVQLGGKELVNFASNDYLALAADERLAKAVAAGLKQDSWGSGASPLLFGRGKIHRKLEQQLAEFEAAEAALVFSSGYAANVGAITALVGRGDVVFSDEKNHASIIDGCRLSGARVQVYPHGDCGYLEKMLQQSTNFRRRLIATDGLFSMGGNLAPLPEIARLADRHQAMLLVDEAHATGVFGAHGRGVCEHLEVEERVDVRVGTLSKALGSGGGFVVGTRELIDWLVNRARSYVFSTAPPGPWCAAASAALEIVSGEPDRRRQLLQQADFVRQELRRQGWNTGPSESQIIPVVVGAPQPTMRLAQALREQGLLVPGIRPPSVPEGESLLRLSLSWAHTPEMLHELLETMSSLRKSPGERGP